jgi:restriction system protein
MARHKSKESLLSLGLSLVGVGLMILLVPTLLRANPVFDAITAGLRYPGWFTLGLGVVLIVIHRLVTKQRTVETHTPARHAPRTRTARKQSPAFDRSDMRRSPKTGDDRVGAAFAPTPPVTTGTAAPALDPAHKRLTCWSPEVFAAIEWRRFEAVCEALFAQAGFETRAQSHGPDGGVDIWLHSRHAEGPVAVVQCKHWHSKQVPVSALREFYGVMASHKLTRGTYATSSTFTTDALAFAQANGINAQNGAGLLKLISQRTPEQQAALLAVAFEGEYWRPTCPSCGTKMVDRPTRKTGERFWGCSNFPRCDHTQRMTRVAANSV